MARTSVAGIKISGISSVLPAMEQNNQDLDELIELAERQRITESTGIRKQRLARPGQTSLDLAKTASNNLLDELGWLPQEVGLLIFVTQTPDYPFPGNAVQLQHHLGLPKSTIAFDVNLGCSGFIYGMWQSMQLLSGLSSKKALLVVGDTTSTQYSSDNRAVNALFGDAVSIIALEKDSQTDPVVFDLGSDGSGAPYLIQPNKGAKHPDTAAELFMDGTQVFVFTLKEVPKSILACLEEKQWAVSDVDYCIMHQANEMMLKRLGNKLGFTPEQMIISMQDIGNTSSASIPLAMTLTLQQQLLNKKNKLLLSGFGVGWSWGSMAYEQTELRLCRLLDLKENR
jgi:3-oxoacyl-[acyl-carrier-protein] synthase-3